MSNIVYKIGIVSENPDDSAEFYIKHFSYTKISTSDILADSVLLRGLAGPLLHILPFEAAQSECGLHHIALAVENVRFIILNMEKNGGRRASGNFKKLLDGPSSVFMEDPEGILLQLVDKKEKLG
tara:strand:- start:282 stop:656 length:375 start_codon:yes stop_codon:yes gene_type:complete